MSNVKIIRECCSKRPVIALPAGEKLCKTHFIDYFEGKVFRTIRQFGLLEKQERLAVALSGGKDSMTVLSILRKLSLKNPKIEILALAIDEGIKGYREKSLEVAQNFCRKNGIELHIFSYGQEFGLTLDEMLKILEVKPCTVCGIFRRYLLNIKSRELCATKLATGHNLDDESQSIMMNQMKNNIEASARLGPTSGSAHSDSFIPRIKPLYLCTEKEVTTYAFIMGLLDDFNECPNVVDSYRAQVRDMLNDMEQKSPGTKYSIVNSFLSILPLLKEKYKENGIALCAKCKEPCANSVCNACAYLEKLKEKVAAKSISP